MTTPHRDALSALAALWTRERREARARFNLERATTPLSKRLARGVAAQRLQLAEVQIAAGGKLRLWIAPSVGGPLPDTLRLGPGDPVSLYRDAPDEPGAVRGVIAKRKRDALAVVIDGELPEPLDEGTFHLDLEDHDATFDRGDRAIQASINASPASPLAQLCAILFGHIAPQHGAQRPWTPLDEDLHEVQRQAVSLALHSRDVALIHGPPGTGKTRTLVEIIRQSVARGQRVLVCAASNLATDHVAAKLLAYDVPLVRLGHVARVSEAVEAATLDAQIERHATYALTREWLDRAEDARRRLVTKDARGELSRDERRALRQEIGALRRDARQHLARLQDAVMARAQVVCVTCAGAASKLLADARFDLLVIDEATQASDPLMLIALMRAERVVLAGDPCQLPPTVLDPQVAREGLATTAFERVRGRHPNACVMLVRQHRMHEAIMAFPAVQFYGDALIAADAVRAHTLEDLGVGADPLREGPLLFIDTAGKGWEELSDEEDPSTSNPLQAERVVAELRRLLSRGLPAVDVGLISPYDAQARLLRQLLAPELAQGLEVATVDGFQGREKEAIVVDLVRSNTRGQLGFLADVRRLNVALTRARRFLLVVGDSATLGAHETYGAMLDAVQARGRWISAWEDEAPPLSCPR